MKSTEVFLKDISSLQSFKSNKSRTLRLLYKFKLKLRLTGASVSWSHSKRAQVKKKKKKDFKYLTRLKSGYKSKS